MYYYVYRIPLKVVIVGDEGVGKTTFVLRITVSISSCIYILNIDVDG